MQDMKAHLTGLTVKAFACRKIATRAADPDERVDYNRQADQFERMAEAVRHVIAAQKKTRQTPKAPPGAFEGASK
jgi:hypothetical protein